jgi:hypothetical protein
VINSDYKIVILDDGTPQKYFDKLSKKYPDLTILKSSLYDEKVNGIEMNLQEINPKVPIDLWIDGAKNATDYFVLLEDDIWFTSAVDLDNLEIFLKKEKIQMLKLYWLGNPKLISGNIIKKHDFYSIFKPKLFVKNALLYKLIFKYYKYKTRKTLAFFNIYTKERALNYYTVYATSGAIFDRTYFLTLWKNHKNNIDEGLQLYNAVKFISKNKKAAFGFTNEEILKTGFLSSATNQHKNYKNVNIDMFAFNKIMNEAWFNNDFDVMDNFPKDLNPQKIEAILDAKNNVFAKKEEWQNWVMSFKKQYTSFGCKID